MILAKEKNRVLVISQYALDCSWYCQKRYVTWETCSLRKWLNNDFLHSAFTENEQKIILTVNVSADQNPEKNPEDNLSQGKNTKDQIFLLSYNEVEKYLDSLEKRKCIATEYCLEKGVDTKNYRFKYSMETTACNWWIRTLGASDRACYVSTDGDLNAFGKVINDGYFGIRPAMWISIE